MSDDSMRTEADATALRLRNEMMEIRLAEKSGEIVSTADIDNMGDEDCRVVPAGHQSPVRITRDTKERRCIEGLIDWAMAPVYAKLENVQPR